MALRQVAPQQDSLRTRLDAALGELRIRPTSIGLRGRRAEQKEDKHEGPHRRRLNDFPALA
jgi:hypothetical protein